MAFEPNNTALEFDAMLRNHLSRGGSMVEACAGFDADLASAYLENVLGTSARSRYDAHLAGCPSCRRHIIELSRLINEPQIIPQTQPQVYPVPESAGLWERLRAAVNDWFSGLDFSSSKWGWGTAGATVAVLIGIFSVQLWRQQQPALQPATENIAAAVVTPSETPQPDSGFVLPAELQRGVTAENEAGKPQISNSFTTQVPRPEVGPMSSGTNVLDTLPVEPVQAGNRQLAFSISDAASPVALRSQPPMPPQIQLNSGNLAPSVTGGATSVNFPDRLGAMAPPPSSESTALATEKSNESVVAAKINPSPSDNPMVRNNKKQKEPQTRGVLDKALSFLPTRDSNDERKLEEKEIEKDSPRLLTIRVRDKVLSYQSGMWVDHAYKPEMAWRVTKLTRDSEEYKQVLAAEPQLKEFFERGTIILVWKDKIYKVVEK